jgi:hypothetical protein
VADDDGDVDVGPDGRAQSVELPPLDGAAVAQLGQRLGFGPAEARAQTGGEDDHLHRMVQRAQRRRAGQISRRARQGSVVGPHVHPLSWVVPPAESPVANSRSSTRSDACPSSSEQKVRRKPA